MRVWDIHPGYLARQSLLGEHNEIHGLWTVVTESRRGYAQHPETLRWQEHLHALYIRHEHVVAEMGLRGYNHHSPLSCSAADTGWPSLFLDRPAMQFARLKEKYADGRQGRLPLPRNCQELWAQHKYSVMARSQQLYRSLGPVVAKMSAPQELDQLAEQLVLALRLPVSHGSLVNALLHMWGYVNELGMAFDKTQVGEMAKERPAHLLAAITHGAQQVPYLWSSTALSDLAVAAYSVETQNQD